MFQNLGLSSESAHANAEASVSGHRLDSGGKSRKRVSKKRDFSQNRKKMGLRTILRDLNDFAGKTEFGNVSEYFYGIEVTL